ncbi:AbrB/MazE/SpoVT family DNA-binding domain-containing protein [Candidatus Desantisbacteria bacterium]|nr:AbrB/MazE/SpoVT family DNA-binding domain-containing protein [Candidatus Desantisbacteria bacterium]
MSIVKVREKYQMTIPQDVRKRFPCEVGEYVKIEVENSRIVIRPMDIEEKLSGEEIFLLEKALGNTNNQGKIMESGEFKAYLRKV